MLFTWLSPEALIRFSQNAGLLASAVVLYIQIGHLAFRR